MKTVFHQTLLKSLFLFLSLSGSLSAKIEFSGHNKFSSFVLRSGELNSGGLSNQTRLNFWTDALRFMDFEAAGEVGLLFFSNPDIAAGLQQERGKNYRLIDPPNLGWNEKKGQTFFVLLNIDRFNFRRTFSFLDLTIGRQAISYGNSNHINPISIFPPNFGLAFDSEYSQGVDAIRMIFPITETSEIEATNIFTDRSESNALALRVKFPLLELSNEITGFYFYEHFLLGLSHQFNFHDIEVLSSMSLTFGKNKERFFRGSWGLQYFFPWEVLANMEYHYSSLGQEIGNPNFDFAFKEAGVYLRNSHYMSFSGQKTFDGIHSLMLSTMIIPEDHSVLLTGSFEHSGDNELYFQASVNYLVSGKKKPNQFMPNVISFSLKKYF